MTVVRAVAKVVIIALLLAAGRAALADEPQTLQGAEELIVRADARGANRDFDGAIKLLSQAVERYPTYERAYLALATWQEVRGLLSMTSAAGDNLDAHALLEMSKVEILAWLVFSGATAEDLARARTGTREQALQVALFQLRKRALRKDLTKYPDVVRELFDTYAQATMFLEDTRGVRRRVADLVSEDFPLVLGENGPLALPAAPVPFTYAIRDAQLAPEQPVAFQGLMTTEPLSAPARYAADPKYRAAGAKGDWTFRCLLLAYEYERAARLWKLRFRVMWQDVPRQREGRAQLARDIAGLLLRLSWLARQRAGLSPRFATDGVINVWLAENGQAGGEAYNDNVYLFEVGKPRPAMEWIREVAHEYGHQTLPVVGGYDKPEWGANGRLGERLMMRWLVQNPETGAETPAWLQQLDAAELRDNRIGPLIRRFAEIGPEMPQIRGKDAAAMDLFVGMALYLEVTRGSPLLASALRGMSTPSFSGPNGFLQSLESQEEYFQGLDQPTVMLQLGDLPAGLPLWVYLRKGTWQGKFERQGPGAISGKLDMDGKAVKMDEVGAFTVLDLAPGWHRIRLILPEGEAAPLAALALRRQ